MYDKINSMECMQCINYASQYFSERYVFHALNLQQNKMHPADLYTFEFEGMKICSKSWELLFILIWKLWKVA